MASNSARIGQEVFNHRVGEVQSYLGRSRMLSAVNAGASAIGPVDVGASTGSTTVEISESKVFGFSSSVSLSYETTVKSNAGPVMSGFSVGGQHHRESRLYQRLLGDLQRHGRRHAAWVLRSGQGLQLRLVRLSPTDAGGGRPSLPGDQLLGGIGAGQTLSAGEVGNILNVGRGDLAGVVLR